MQFSHSNSRTYNQADLLDVHLCCGDTNEQIRMANRRGCIIHHYREKVNIY